LAGGAALAVSKKPACVPKPMIEIGGGRFLAHIMKIYGHHGINDS